MREKKEAAQKLLREKQQLMQQQRLASERTAHVSAAVSTAVALRVSDMSSLPHQQQAVPGIQQQHPSGQPLSSPQSVLPSPPSGTFAPVPRAAAGDSLASIAGDQRASLGNSSNASPRTQFQYSLPSTMPNNSNSNTGFGGSAEFSAADIAALDEFESNLQQHQQQNQPFDRKRARVQ
jgi:hypothetical protein